MLLISRPQNKRQIQKIAQLAIAVAVCFSFAAPALADTFDDQINALNQQIAAQQAQINDLQAQADTLANKLAVLNAQIAAINYQIQLNTQKIAQVRAGIADATAQLASQKATLDENIRDIYQQGAVTPIEVLASSDSISDFADKQQYTQKVKDNIDGAMAKIKALQADLERQEQDLSKLLADLNAQQQSVAASRNEQANLLAQTQGEEANYQALVASNKAKLSAVVAARAAAIRQGQLRVSSGGCGGYPSIWCNAPQDSTSDDWHFYNRECVSYVAWKRWAMGLAPQPNFWGNASDWEAHVDHRSGPQAGDIAVWGAYANAYVGGYGHVAYVESVSGSSITVSQYNFDVGNGSGQYSLMTIGSGDTMMGGIGYISGH